MTPWRLLRLARITAAVLLTPVPLALPSTPKELTMKIGDTVRVLSNEPHGAQVKEGTHGTITEISEIVDSVRVRFANGVHWAFQSEDLAVVSMEDLFEFLTTDLSDFEDTIKALVDLYDAPPPAPGVPVESVVPIADNSLYAAGQATETATPTIPATVTSTGADENCGPECPNVPHHHKGDTATAIPHLRLTDPDGDIIDALDLREMTDGGTEMRFRVQYPRSGNGGMHVNLTESQALALAAFILKTFRAT